MKDIVKEKDIEITFDLRLLTSDPSKLLFFDIETTGLSPHASSLYLIGMLFLRGGKTVFRQLFAEDMKDELPVLRSFFEFTKEFDTLIHFNGDTFDIPYLEACAAQYGLSCPLRELRSVDILKLVRKEKSLLRLESCRQKAVEGFLGIEREDLYSGGELIPVYQAYERDRDPEKEHFLLLHNEEDVCGMPSLLPILSYRLASEATDFILEKTFLSSDGSERSFCLRFPCFFPKELRCERENGLKLRYCRNRIELSVPVYRGELKYFYPNYRDYCYLPKEDRAIHKKLAAFVEKPYKLQATADTCYTKISGEFLPALKGSSSPLFSESRKSDKLWTPLSDDLSFFEAYCKALLGTL